MSIVRHKFTLYIYKEMVFFFFIVVSTTIYDYKPPFGFPDHWIPRDPVRDSESKELPS